MTAFEALKRAGFLFMKGAPPQTEDGSLIIWDGDCACRAVQWQDGRLVCLDWSTPDRAVIQNAPLDPAGIICWMRMPHPSIWPEVFAQPDLASELELFHNGDYRAKRAEFLAVLGANPSLNMVLNCPACGLQHIDEPSEGWDNPPHRSHLCQGCGEIWRPADVPTNGVGGTITRGDADTWVGEPADLHRSVAKSVKKMIDEKNRQINSLRVQLAAAIQVGISKGLEAAAKKVSEISECVSGGVDWSTGAFECPKQDREGCFCHELMETVEAIRALKIQVAGDGGTKQ